MSGGARRVHFETLGCRLNQDETEGAARAFSAAGFCPDMSPVSASTESASGDGTVLCIINTCTVTGKAEQKARRLIRLMLSKFQDAPVLVTGCYAELDSAEIKRICPHRIVTLRGTEKHALSLLARSMGDEFGRFCADGSGALSAERIQDFLDSNSPRGGANESLRSLSPRKAFKIAPESAFTLYTPVFERHSRASMKLQDGCNCACSFCRIHLARGKSVSLDVAEAVRRARELEARGAAEIVCTGVNLSQYRSCLNGVPVDFAGLLRILIDSTERVRFRVSSFYPQSIDESLCRVLESPRVQPFFHLSIQSGSDRILSLMNRPHSVEHVKSSIAMIRSAKRNPFISCDIIAGFPGETEDDFSLTQELCMEQGFAWIHAFPFSPRPGTPAESMRPHVPERVKTERVGWLTRRAVEGKIAYIKSWEGETVSAVVERGRGQGDKIHVVTENFLHAECAPPEGGLRPGGIVDVRIESPLEESIIAGRETDCAGTIVPLA